MFLHVICTPMVIVNRFQHSSVVHKRTNILRIHKESPFPGSLESKTKFNILEVKETAEPVNHTGSCRESDIRGIIHVNDSILVYITVANVSRHDVSSLGRRIVDLCLVTEKSLGNVTDLLRQFMPLSPLPFRLTRGFLDLPISGLTIRERTVQNHPKVRSKSVLYLTRKINTPRTSLTHVTNLRLLQTSSRGHRVTIIQNIMPNFLINVSI